MSKHRPFIEIEADFDLVENQLDAVEPGSEQERVLQLKYDALVVEVANIMVNPDMKSE